MLRTIVHVTCFGMGMPSLGRMSTNHQLYNAILFLLLFCHTLNNHVKNEEDLHTVKDDSNKLAYLLTYSLHGAS